MAAVEEIRADKGHRFGHPRLVNYGLETWILMNRFEAGESIEEIAKDFDIPNPAVEAAIRFEHAERLWAARMKKALYSRLKTQ